MKAFGKKDSTSPYVSPSPHHPHVDELLENFEQDTESGLIRIRFSIFTRILMMESGMWNANHWKLSFGLKLSAASK